jgi:hypothetical protein
MGTGRTMVKAPKTAQKPPINFPIPESGVILPEMIASFAYLHQSKYLNKFCLFSVILLIQCISTSQKCSKYSKLSVMIALIWLKGDTGNAGVFPNKQLECSKGNFK